MQPIKNLFFATAIAGTVIIVAGGISTLALMKIGNSDNIDIPTGKLLARNVTNLLETKCAACHGDNPEFNPLLNALSGGLMQRDVEQGQRDFRLSELYGDTNPDARRMQGIATLKLDKVLRANSMPPVAYTAMHWGSTLNAYDRKLLSSYFDLPFINDLRFMPIEPVDMSKLNPDRVLLGQKLFNSGALSTDGTISCASCHDLTKGGTDNKQYSEGVRKQLGGVNAPSVYNSSHNFIQFWDGRAKDLKAQAGGPPLNPVEMGFENKPESWNTIVANIKQDPELVALFAKAYPKAGINADTITDAIATYEHTLVTPDSNFDLYLKGDKNALTAEQKKGMHLFIEYGCATCHAGAGLGGQSYEYISKHADFFNGKTLAQNAPMGRHDATKKNIDQLCFKVPNLRNVELTHPYLHDGSAKTLDEAVVKMLQTQSGIPHPTRSDVSAIVSFLKAQTGKLNGIPVNKLTKEQALAPAVTVAAPAPVQQNIQ